MKPRRLLGKRCYLCGSIDRSADNGAGWRDRITPELIKRGVFVSDPLNKPIGIGTETMDQKPHRKRLKAEGRYDEFSQIMKPVRLTDLRLVDGSDFMITSIDMDIHLAGSYEEVCIANRQKKPVLCFCVQGKAQAADWLFAQVPHEHIFESSEELLSYLDYYDTAPDPPKFNRWVDFDLKGFYNRDVLNQIIAHLDSLEV